MAWGSHTVECPGCGDGVDLIAAGTTPYVYISPSCCEVAFTADRSDGSIVSVDGASEQ